MVSKGQFLGLDWNRAPPLHSQVMKGTHMNSLTALRCHIKAYLDAANQPQLVEVGWPLLTIESPVAQWFNSHLRLGIFSEFVFPCI